MGGGYTSAVTYAAIGLDDAGAGRDEIDERAGLRQHLEHLARRRRDQQIEPRGDALRLEQRRRREHVAERGPRVAAEDDLRHRLAGQIAHRAHHALFVEEQRIDGGEIDADRVLARRARIGHQRAVRLRAALIAEEDLRLLVADEERGGGADLRRDAAEHGALADRQEARARPRELEHDGRFVLALDAADDLVEVPAQELERDVARADERPHAPREVDLHAARRAQPHRARRERVAELRGRHDERQHADAADGREARVVRQREARGRGEPLEVHGRREPDARPRDRDVVAREVGRDRVRTAALLIGDGRGIRDAGAVSRRPPSRGGSSSGGRRSPRPARGRGRATG